MSFIKKIQPYHLFLISWLVLNIIQAAYTQLTSDEGYYWFYAHSLDWGYYDHPPMVALMIKTGSLLFKGELGVRIVNVFFCTGAVYLFFRLLPPALKNNYKVFILLLSCPLVHYLTFIVFPDGPLLFFSLLFLFVYKRFIEKQLLGWAILMGLCMALMFYSKYHGVLVVFFTVLANIKLLRAPKFYFAAFIAIICFLPHIVWQFQHHFVTLGYHLSGRTDPLSFHHVPEYLSQQIPAIGPGLVFVPFVYKTKDLFERTLQVIIIGTLIFFLGSSFKTFVHFHWTSIALFPILILASQYYTSRPGNKLFYWLVFPFVGLIVITRLQLLFSFLPLNHANVDYYEDRDKWAQDIEKLSGQRPVFFPNNLREAGLYSFYSGKMGVALYGRPEKKTQYDLWHYEDSIQNKEVMMAALNSYGGSTSFLTRMGQTIYYSIIPSFHSYFDQVPIAAQLENRVSSDSTVEGSLVITNQRSYPISFERNADGASPVLIYSIEKADESIRSDTLKIFAIKDGLEPGNSLREKFHIRVKGLPPGSYRLLFGIRFGIIPDAINSNALPLVIK